MTYYINPEENEMMLGWLRKELEEKGDGKCYCPCIQYRDLNRGIILKTIDKKHCRKYGNTGGGYDYHPLVSYSLYVFVLIAFIKKMYHFNICCVH